MKVAGKDAAILALLDRLAAALGGRFAVVDHWDDPSAIGIASPDDQPLLVYVAVYPNGYYYECELPRPDRGPDELPYDICGSGSGVDFVELVAAIRRHLRLARSDD